MILYLFSSGEEEKPKDKKKKETKLHLPKVEFHPVHSVKTLLSPRSQKKAEEESMLILS